MTTTAANARADPVAGHTTTGTAAGPGTGTGAGVGTGRRGLRGGGGAGAAGGAGHRAPFWMRHNNHALLGLGYDDDLDYGPYASPADAEFPMGGGTWTGYGVGATGGAGLGAGGGAGTGVGTGGGVGGPGAGHLGGPGAGAYDPAIDGAGPGVGTGTGMGRGGRFGAGRGAGVGNGAGAGFGHGRNVAGGGRASIGQRLKYDMGAVWGEFLGTFFFLWLAYMGTQTAAYAQGSYVVGNHVDGVVAYLTALSFAVSLAATMWIFYRISGATFNPAVTVSLWLVGAISFPRAFMFFIAQLVAGIIAAAIAKGFTHPDLRYTPICTTVPRMGDGAAMAAEMFATAFFILTVLMVMVEKQRSTFLAPVALGLSYFIASLATMAFTSGGLNPARCFGPSTVQGYFPGNAWLWYVGEFLGSLLAVYLYWTIKNFDRGPFYGHAAGGAGNGGYGAGVGNGAGTGHGYTKERDPRISESTAV